MHACGQSSLLCVMLNANLAKVETDRTNQIKLCPISSFVMPSYSNTPSCRLLPDRIQRIWEMCEWTEDEKHGGEPSRGHRASVRLSAITTFAGWRWEGGHQSDIRPPNSDTCTLDTIMNTTTHTNPPPPRSPLFVTLHSETIMHVFRRTQTCSLPLYHLRRYLRLLYSMSDRSPHTAASCSPRGKKSYFFDQEEKKRKAL